VELREKLRAQDLPPAAVRLLDRLYENPMLTVRGAESLLGVRFATAARALEELEKAGIVREVTGQQRHRRYRFEPYLALFAAGNPGSDPQRTARTESTRTARPTTTTRSNED
jgi:DNA-binding IclR family transcriptional regulator